MRREDKEIRDRTVIDSVIRRSQVCRLGLVDGDAPYVIPMCFGYDGTSLYFHCASNGRKLDIIRRNSRLCFEFDLVEGLVESQDACHWGIRYQSVIGTGMAMILEDVSAKREALKSLMAQYSNKTFTFSEDAVNRATVIRVSIDTLTGKQSAR